MIRVEIASKEAPRQFPDSLGFNKQKPQRYFELTIYLGIRGLGDLCSRLSSAHLNGRLGKLLGPLAAVLVFVLIGVLVSYTVTGSFFPAYDSKNTLVERPTLWIIALVFVGYATRQLFLGRQVARVHVYPLRPGQPFPVLNPSLVGANTQILAVRVLEPTVRRRLDSYLRVDDSNRCATHQKYCLSRSRPPDMAFVLRHPEQSMSRVARSNLVSADDFRLGADFWPLVRLAVDRVLFEPLFQIGKYDTDRDLVSKGFIRDIASGPGPRRLAFALKLFTPQIVGLFLLVACAIGFAASGARIHHGSQYPVGLAGLGVLWCCFSIWLYRRQHNVLLHWAASWATKPLGACPIFSYQRENDPRYVWEELTPDDFEVRITEFGLDVERVFHIAFGILLVAYIGFLEVIK